MGRYLSWLFAAWLAPAPEELAPAAPPPAPSARTWDDRQAILKRNLFNASQLAPIAPLLPLTPEVIEATALPLELLGTVSSPDPALSWAAVQDSSTRKLLVLQINDDIQGGNARVTDIERKRIVLNENGKPRELALANPAPTPPKPKAGTSDRRSRKSRASQRGRSRTRAEPPAPRTVPPAAATPAPQPSLQRAANLFSQAQILPRFADGQMVGIELDSIEAGSVFEQAGLQNGDLISAINGVRITSPEESSRLMAQLADAESFTVTVEGDAGAETLQVALPAAAE
jgi:type II secretion system protein C